MHRAVAMAVVVTGVVLATGAVIAQSAPLTIISSVKPTKDVDEGIKGRGYQGGVYRYSNAPLTIFLRDAYGVDAQRVIGPDWIGRDRWDVEAKADRNDGGALRTRDLVQAMLRDRFKLDAVMEKRDRPIYALRIARQDGRLGPNLVRSTFECVQNDVRQMQKLVDSGVRGSNGDSPCGTRSQRGIVSFAGLPITNLVPHFFVDRVVQDQTGLTGPFDVTLTWTFSGDTVADQASMFSALREQLGLKLESATAPLDVLVIKSVSRPDPN